MVFPGDVRLVRVADHGALVVGAACDPSVLARRTIEDLDPSAVDDGAGVGRILESPRDSVSVRRRPVDDAAPLGAVLAAHDGNGERMRLQKPDDGQDAKQFEALPLFGTYSRRYRVLPVRRSSYRRYQYGPCRRLNSCALGGLGAVEELVERTSRRGEASRASSAHTTTRRRHRRIRARPTPVTSPRCDAVSMIR